MAINEFDIAISQDITGIVLKKEYFSKYIYYFLNHFNNSLTSLIQGTSINGITRNVLGNISIISPPLPEQTAIATALSDVDALISGLDRLIEKKRAIKQAAMQELLTGKRRLPGFDSGKGYKQTEVGEIPEDWDVFPFFSISSKMYNGGTPSTIIEEYWKGNIPWVTGADFIDQKISEIRRYITLEAVKNSATNIIPKNNLLVVTRTGVGKLAISEFDIAISQDITGVVLKKEYSPKFIYYFLNHFNNCLTSLIQGTSINGITRNVLGDISIISPPLLEQTAIATVLSDMDAEISALETRKTKTISLKQGMMQELLTGRIRLV